MMTRSRLKVKSHKFLRKRIFVPVHAYSSLRENLFFVFLIFTLLEKIRVLAKLSKMCNAPVSELQD